MNPEFKWEPYGFLPEPSRFTHGWRLLHPRLAGFYALRLSITGNYFAWHCIKDRDLTSVMYGDIFEDNTNSFKMREGRTFLGFSRDRSVMEERCGEHMVLARLMSFTPAELEQAEQEYARNHARP